MNAAAHAPRVLALVHPGGVDRGLDVVSRARSVAELPYAGSFRLIDLPLSNLRNSGIRDVRVLEEGRSAEELSTVIRQHGADAILLVGVGAAYRLDYAQVVTEHLRRDAECTVVTADVVEDSTTVATDVVVVRPETLIESLAEVLRHGNRALARLSTVIERGRVNAYPMPGSWRDLDRPETYLAAHRGLLAGEPALFDRDWPLAATGTRRLPARLRFGCSVTDSMISDGCEISGAVRNSVLGPGVVVEPGGQVRDSVLGADVIVRSGGTVDWSILGQGCEIGGGAKVGGANPREITDPGCIAVLGADCRIEPGSRVPRGSRLEPGTVVEAA